MSTITQSQAMDFEQRLIALERKVGTDRITNRTTAAASLDERLTKVKQELQTKLHSHNNNNNNNNNNNKASTNQESWTLIQKLLKELDPGIALTHQQQPLLYKRQQVLACSDELMTDFGHLETILKLLLSGTKVNAGDATTLSTSSSSSTTTTTTTKAKTSNPMKTPTKAKSAAQQQQQTLEQAKEKAQEKLQQQQQQQQQHDGRNSNDTLRLDQVTQAPILTQHYSKSPHEEQQCHALAAKFLDLNQRTQALQQTLGKYLEIYHTTAMAVSEKIVLADEQIRQAQQGN